MSWISDVKHDLGKLDISTKSLKKFGLTVGAVFLIISAWFYFKDIFYIAKIVLLVVGAVLIAGGLLFPNKLKSVYKLWMGIAFILGWLVSRIILTFLFFLILMPVGLIAKIFGKKFINDDWKKKSDTYWIKKDHSEKSNYEKMF